jgi:hypothetical protein
MSRAKYSTVHEYIAQDDAVMLTLCRLPPQVVDFHDDAAAGPYASSEYPFPPNVGTFHLSCLPDQSRAAQALPGIASPGCVSKPEKLVQ